MFLCVFLPARTANASDYSGKSCTQAECRALLEQARAAINPECGCPTAETTGAAASSSCTQSATSACQQKLMTYARQQYHSASAPFLDYDTAHNTFRLPWAGVNRDAVADMTRRCGGDIRGKPFTTTACWAEYSTSLHNSLVWTQADGANPCGAVARLAGPARSLHSRIRQSCCMPEASQGSRWAVEGSLSRINCVTGAFATIRAQLGNFLKKKKIGAAADAAMRIQLITGPHGAQLNRENWEELEQQIRTDFGDNDALARPRGNTWAYIPASDPPPANPSTSGSGGQGLKGVGTGAGGGDRPPTGIGADSALGPSARPGGPGQQVPPPAPTSLGSRAGTPGGSDSRSQSGSPTGTGDGESSESGGTGGNGTGSGSGSGEADGGGDLYVQRCIRNTFSCSAEMENFKRRQTGECEACTRGLRATDELERGTDAVLASFGIGASQTHVDAYLGQIRKAAIVANLRTLGQLTGDYNFRSVLGPADHLAVQNGCMSDPELRAAIDEHSGALKPDDAEAFAATRSREYRSNMARAAMEIARDMYRWSYYEHFKSGSNFDSRGIRLVPDPDCADYSSRVTERQIMNGLDGSSLDSSAASARSACCSRHSTQSLQGYRFGARSLADSSCAWTANAESLQREAATRIQAAFRAYPLLAAGMRRHGTDMFDLTALNLSNTPGVSGILRAAFAGNTDAMYDFKFSDRGTRAIPEAILGEVPDVSGDNPVTTARERARSDLARSIANLCRGENGGVEGWDLVRMKGLVDQVIATTESQNPSLASLYRVVQECSLKGLAEHSSDRTVGQALLGASCLVVGVMSVGVAAPACGAMFFGLSVLEYREASHRASVLRGCGGGAAGSVGICSMEEVLSATEEEASAKFNMYFTGIVEGLTLGSGGAISRIRAIRAASRALSAGEIQEAARAFGTLDEFRRLGPARQLEVLAEQERMMTRLAADHAARQATLRGVARSTALSETVENTYLARMSARARTRLRLEVDLLEESALSSGKSGDEIAEIIDRRMTGCTP